MFPFFLRMFACDLLADTFVMVSCRAPLNKNIASMHTGVYSWFALPDG